MRLANLLVMFTILIAACGDEAEQRYEVVTATAEVPDSLTIEEKMVQHIERKLEQRHETPDWVVQTQGVPDACALKEELRGFRDYATVSEPEHLGGDLAGYYDLVVKEMVVARALAIFDSNFGGCRNSDGYMELSFLERDQMVREMAETGVKPEDVGLTPTVIRDRLLAAAREVFRNNPHVLEEPTDANGGAGACRTESPEWYAVSRMVQTYHFTSADLGVDAESFNRCVYGN